MKKLARVSGLLMTLSLCSSSALQVSTRDQLVAAVSQSKAGDTIYLENGTYTIGRLLLEKSGSPGKQISILAENPGEAVFDNSTELVILGDYWRLSGIKFSKIAATTGVSVITIGGSHVEIDECLFDMDSRCDREIISLCTSLADRGKALCGKEQSTSRYIRVHNCAFVQPAPTDNSVTSIASPILNWRQVNIGADAHQLVLNKIQDPQFLEELMTPTYNRIDHCYFGVPTRKTFLFLKYETRGKIIDIPGIARELDLTADLEVYHRRRVGVCQTGRGVGPEAMCPAAFASS